MNGKSVGQTWKRAMESESSSSHPKETVTHFLGWYSREQWPLLLSLASDAGELAPTYDEWMASINRGLSELRQSGVVPNPIEIDVEALNLWCQGLDIPLDGEARAKYVAEVGRSRTETSR
jgi:hypothetical protein